MSSVACPSRGRPLGVPAHVTLPSGRRRTVCSTAVLAYLGVDMRNVRYSENLNDIKRHLRAAGFHVRSRMSALGAKGKSVGQVRAAIAHKGEGVHHLVRVDGHAMLLDGLGRTVVDTDPRERDRRKVTHVYAVFRGVA